MSGARLPRPSPLASPFPLQALFGTLTLDVMALTVAYSLAGLGIAIVNDFKSIEGDRWGGTVPCGSPWGERWLAAVVTGEDVGLAIWP